MEDEPIQVVDKRRFAQAAEEGEDADRSTEPQAEEAARYPSFVEELQNRLKQAEEQAEKVQSRFKQMQAELQRETDELRARLQRNADARFEAAKGELLKKFLEASDNLERAVLSAESGSGSATLLAGVKATQALMLKQFEAEGVQQIAALGEPFDPQIHEAVDTVEVEPERDGKVVEVYKTGYMFGDKLLRPAVVRVGRGQAAHR